MNFSDQLLGTAAIPQPCESELLVDCTFALALRSRRDERIIASELSAAVEKEHSRCREYDYRWPRSRNERIGRFHYDRHRKRIAD
jgi:hypothetical protein